MTLPTSDMSASKRYQVDLDALSGHVVCCHAELLVCLKGLFRKFADQEYCRARGIEHVMSVVHCHLPVHACIWAVKRTVLAPNLISRGH